MSADLRVCGELVSAFQESRLLGLRRILREGVLGLAERCAPVQAFVEHCRAWKLRRGRRAVVGYPFGLHNIELTNRCPMRCVMCARTHGMTRAQGNMGFALFRRWSGWSRTMVGFSRAW